jgi:ribose 1,5-bisphosphokinase PhnN
MSDELERGTAPVTLTADTAELTARMLSRGREAERLLRALVADRVVERARPDVRLAVGSFLKRYTP